MTGRPRCDCCERELTLAELGQEIADQHRACPGRLRMQVALSTHGEDRSALTYYCHGCRAAGEFPGTRAEGEAALASFAATGTIRPLSAPLVM